MHAALVCTITWLKRSLVNEKTFYAKSAASGTELVTQLFNPIGLKCSLVWISSNLLTFPKLLTYIAWALVNFIYQVVQVALQMYKNLTRFMVFNSPASPYYDYNTTLCSFIV
jgi:hypothetical protein